jgi:uroporphyrinogen decarboxylase
MISRERVLAAVNRRVPDRVPLDFSANRATLERLQRDLAVATRRDLLERLHADILDLRGVVEPTYRGPIPKEFRRPDGVMENWLGWRTRTLETATGPEECFCEFVLASARSLSDLQHHRWPEVDWFDWSGFAARLAPWRGLALMASGASVFQHAAFLRGFENLLADLAGAPAMFDYVTERLTEFYLAYFEQLFAAAPGQIDLFRIADDLAMQDRLLFSLATFDRHVAPRLQPLIELGHRHGVKVMFHSCGAIEPLIERLIDLGVDILDPIQVRAKGMDPEQLQQRYGGRIVFHGAVDTQYLLPQGSPQDVARAVRRLIDCFGPGGGFILAPSHVLQTDVPTENVLALYETGFQYGGTYSKNAP